MTSLYIGVAVMAVVTFLPRALPLALVRRPVENRFLRDFLEYMPYAVLGAMTFPAILYATEVWWSALAGLTAALLLAWHKKGLLPVALAATTAVWIVEAVGRMV